MGGNTKRIAGIAAAFTIMAGAGVIASTGMANANANGSSISSGTFAHGIARAVQNAKKGGTRPDCIPFYESEAYNSLKYGGDDEPGENNSWLSLSGIGSGRTPAQREEAEAAWQALPEFDTGDGDTYGWIRVSDRPICSMLNQAQIDRLVASGGLGNSEHFNKLAAALAQARENDIANGGRVTPW